MADAGGLRVIAHRAAAPADGPALDAMAQRVWRETFGHSAAAADIDAYLAEAYGPQGELIRSLGDPAVTVRLAVEDDGEEERIVGYAKLTPPWVAEADDVARAVQLSQLYVASDRHGRGVAPALMDWVIAVARERGAPALFLTVWEENARARRFYDRYGFVHVGDYAFHVGDQVDRDLVMRLSL